MIKYKDYIIEWMGLGYLYSHEDYNGVYEYDGETGQPSSFDRRCGACPTVEKCKEEIDDKEDD